MYVKESGQFCSLEHFFFWPIYLYPIFVFLWSKCFHCINMLEQNHGLPAYWIRMFLSGHSGPAQWLGQSSHHTLMAAAGLVPWGRPADLDHSSPFLWGTERWRAPAPKETSALLVGPCFPSGGQGSTMSLTWILWEQDTGGKSFGVLWILVSPMNLNSYLIAASLYQVQGRQEQRWSSSPPFPFGVVFSVNAQSIFLVEWNHPVKRKSSEETEPFLLYTFNIIWKHRGKRNWFLETPNMDEAVMKTQKGTNMKALSCIFLSPWVHVWQAMRCAFFPPFGCIFSSSGYAWCVARRLGFYSVIKKESSAKRNRVCPTAIYLSTFSSVRLGYC